MRCRTQRSGRRDFPFSEPRSSARAAERASLALRLPARSRWSARQPATRREGSAPPGRGRPASGRAVCARLEAEDGEESPRREIKGTKQRVQSPLERQPSTTSTDRPEMESRPYEFLLQYMLLYFSSS
ncbi:uncharacterized protein ACBT57_011160 [Dama dama]